MQSDIKDYLDAKRKEISKINPSRVDDIFTYGIRTSLELSKNSYDEEMKRTSKIQSSINGMLTFISFLFAGFLLYLTNVCVKNLTLFDLISFITESFILGAIIILLVLATRYRSYECFNQPDVQVEGTFDKLFSQYGVLDNKFVPGLKEIVFLCDLDKVQKSVCKVNDRKKYLLFASIILTIIFVSLFLTTVSVDLIGGFLNAR